MLGAKPFLKCTECMVVTKTRSRRIKGGSDTTLDGVNKKITAILVMQIVTPIIAIIITIVIIWVVMANISGLIPDFSGITGYFS